MAGYIKGITIEFGADTSKLNGALKKTQGTLNKTQAELKQINRALKFNPGNTTLLKQKFELLQRSVKETQLKLKQLKDMQRSMDASGVSRSSAQYRQLEREIIKTTSQLRMGEAELRSFGSIGKQQALAVGAAFQSAGAKIKSVGRTITTTLSVYGLAGLYAGAKLIDSYEQQAQAEQKLEAVYKSSMGASKEAAQATMEYASELQKTGVIGDEVTLAGAAVLAQYAKTPEAVNGILPAMDNYLAKTKGMNATQEDAEAAAKIFGKAMNGNTTALERQGFVLTEQQKELLKTGTEEEKAALLAEVVAQKTGNMNEELAKTDAGKIQQAKMALGDMGEEIGAVLLPAVADLAKWITNNLLPKIQQLIEWLKQHPAVAKFALAFAAITAALGPVLMMIGSLVSIIGSLIMFAPALGGVFAALAGPVGIAVAAIAAAIAVGIALYKNWDTIKAKAKAIWNSISNAVSTVVNRVKTNFNTMKNTVISVFNTIKSTASRVWNGIKSAITKPIETAKATVRGILNKIKGFFPLSIGKIFSNLKIPHIKIQGGKAPYGIGGFGKAPKISVSWNKKAMQQPYMFGNATLFGAGEAGDEMLYGRSALMNDIAKASGIDYTLMANALVSALSEADGNISLYIDGKQMAQAQAPYMNIAINQLQSRQARTLGLVGV